MRIKEIKVYEFDELSQGLKDKVIEKLWDINVDHDWWDAIADDAKQIGCDIREFDIYRRTCYLVLEESPECVAKLILTNHGKHCDTYKVAKSFLKEIEGLEDDEKYTAAVEDFTEDLSRRYLKMLSDEYDYLTSEETIIETIHANEYEFDEYGDIA